MFDWNRWQLYQQAMSPWHWGFALIVVSTAIWLIVWLKSCFREDADDSDQTLEMLTQFRELHQEGGLSNDEFRLIRSRLAQSAQEAIVSGNAKSNQVLDEMSSAQSAEVNWKTTTRTPATNATAKDDSKSERMTDEVTD